MADPQHPPCTEPSHTTGGRECGQGRCGFCGELFSYGQKWQGESGWHYWPAGEYAYWHHTRDSERHQRLLDIQAIEQRIMITRITDDWDTIRVDSRLYQREERQRLLRALR